jgi:RimJ/RimL family protein N-acetyltransferase
MKIFSNLPTGKPQNYPGFEHPLLMRRIQPRDALEFQRIIRDSRKHLEGYIGWAEHSAKWDFHNINQFVMEHVNAELPREHFVFTLGSKIVALGSLAPMPDPMTIQVALFVRAGFTGKGIAKSVTLSLENYAFEVVGYESVYYNCDFSNAASAAIPKSMGYHYVDLIEVPKSAKDETGIWVSYKKDRDVNLPPGILQGMPVDVFTKIVSGEENTYQPDLSNVEVSNPFLGSQNDSND